MRVVTTQDPFFIAQFTANPNKYEGGKPLEQKPHGTYSKDKDELRLDWKNVRATLPETDLEILSILFSKLNIKYI